MLIKKIINFSILLLWRIDTFILTLHFINCFKERTITAILFSCSNCGKHSRTKSGSLITIGHMNGAPKNVTEYLNNKRTFFR